MTDDLFNGSLCTLIIAVAVAGAVAAVADPRADPAGRAVVPARAATSTHDPGTPLTAELPPVTVIGKRHADELLPPQAVVLVDVMPLSAAAASASRAPGR